MRVGDEVTLSRTKVKGTIINIVPENAPHSIQVQWSKNSVGWYLKSALKKVRL